MARTRDGERTVLLSAPLPGADPGRFAAEADAARRLLGSWIAPVTELAAPGETPWYASPYLPALPLPVALAVHGGPLPEGTVRAVGAALAEALAAAHAQGLTHAGVSPAAVLLTADGPRLSCFGAVRAAGADGEPRAGAPGLDPGALAPEQASGGRPRPPGDVFALGAVLAYAASGRRAFDGGHVAAVQYEVVHGAPDLSLVPPELQQLIGPCLTKDPAFHPTPLRIAEAFAPPKGADRAWRKGPLAEDIKRRETATRRLAAPEDTAAPGSAPSRRRFLTMTAVGVAVLGAGGGAGAWWLNREESPTADVPPAVATPEAAFASLIDSEPGKAPKALWGPLDVAARDDHLPLPVRDVLIVPAKTGGLLALSVTDGKERWRANDIDAAAGFAAVAGRLVVGVDKNGVLNAFVASTGAPVWQTGSNAEDVLAADDTQVYLVTKDNRLRAVNAWTLATAWTHPMLSPVPRRAPRKRPRAGSGS